MGIIALFLLAFFFPVFYNATWYLLYVLIIFTFIDVLLLFIPKKNIQAKRVLPEKLSNGDENEIVVYINNKYTFPVWIKTIDEIPFQFQKRNFEIKRKIPTQGNDSFKYTLRPTERGEYLFGKLNIYTSSPLHLVSRRFMFDDNKMVPTYPSYIQLRKYDLIAFSQNLFQYGLKKIRRIGHTMEFEQIKEYVQGDDIRTINWKATAKRNQLMVNQYQDEKSQNVYMVIDKGRVMKMPFNGLSLLDYAINATLVLSNVILKNTIKRVCLRSLKRLKTELWRKNV